MQKSKRNNLITLLMLAILLIVGFFYRIYGLNANHSFWTDEEHVAIFVRAILERGKPVLINGYSTGVYQWLQYWLSAISARIFGLNEFAIRFPSVIFGALTILAVYLLGKELFNKNTGLVVAIFTTFLKIEILWSRQARPYQALQFFYLLGAYFIYKLAKEEKFNWRYFWGFLASAVLASLVHGLGLVIFGVGFLYLLLFRFSWFKKWILPAGLVALVFGDIFRVQIFSVFSNFGDVNNLFYYRVFLWHNYSLLVFLALVGFLFQIFQKKKTWLILILFLAIQGFIVSFLLPQPFTRYFYIVFPFLILLAAVGLESLLPFQKGKTLIFFLLAFLIMIFNQKFALWPQKIYSLNADMQEIPEVDYKKIYSFIEQKLKDNSDTVFISNWNDHPIWYLGEGKLNYLLRSVPSGKKDPVSGATLLTNKGDLLEVIKDKKVLILLESWDNIVPQDVREYIRGNLKKELEVDRLYPVQPRFWPVEVYSWGI